MVSRENENPMMLILAGVIYVFLRKKYLEKNFPRKFFRLAEPKSLVFVHGYSHEGGNLPLGGCYFEFAPRVEGAVILHVPGNPSLEDWVKKGYEQLRGATPKVFWAHSTGVVVALRLRDQYFPDAVVVGLCPPWGPATAVMDFGHWIKHGIVLGDLIEDKLIAELEKRITPRDCMISGSLGIHACVPMLFLGVVNWVGDRIKRRGSRKFDGTVASKSPSVSLDHFAAMGYEGLLFLRDPRTSLLFEKLIARCAGVRLEEVNKVAG